MVGNDIVVIHQMSLLVVVHLLSRCRPYSVSDSSQQGGGGVNREQMEIMVS